MTRPRRKISTSHTCETKWPSIALYHNEGAAITCVISIRDSGKVLLAADSCTSYGTHVDTCDDKLFRCIGMNVGGAGDSLLMQYVQHGLHCKKKDPKLSLADYAKKEIGPKVSSVWQALQELDEDIWGEFLFASGSEVVSITARGEVFSSAKDYMAIGSGSTFAMGSLRNSRGKAEDRALQAINTAAEFLGDVAPPVRMVWT